MAVKRAACRRISIPKRDLELHQDLREAKADPETHYLLHGRNVGGTTADGPRASDRREIIL